MKKEIWSVHIEDFNQEYAVIGVRIDLIDSGRGKRLVVSVDRDSAIKIDQVEDIIEKSTYYAPREIFPEDKDKMGYKEVYDSSKSQITYQHIVTVEELLNIRGKLYEVKHIEYGKEISSLHVRSFNEKHEKLGIKMYIIDVYGKQRLIVSATHLHAADDSRRKENRKNSLDFLDHLNTLINDSDCKEVTDESYNAQRNKVICRDGIKNLEYTNFPLVKEFIHIVIGFNNFVRQKEVEFFLNKSIKFNAGRLLEECATDTYIIEDTDGSQLEINPVKMIFFISRQAETIKANAARLYKEHLDFLKLIHPQDDKGNNRVKLFSIDDINNTMCIAYGKVRDKKHKSNKLSAFMDEYKRYEKQHRMASEKRSKNVIPLDNDNMGAVNKLEDAKEKNQKMKHEVDDVEVDSGEKVFELGRPG